MAAHWLFFFFSDGVINISSIPHSFQKRSFTQKKEKKPSLDFKHHIPYHHPIYNFCIDKKKKRKKKNQGHAQSFSMA